MSISVSTIITYSEESIRKISKNLRLKLNFLVKKKLRQEVYGKDFNLKVPQVLAEGQQQINALKIKCFQMQVML